MQQQLLIPIQTNGDAISSQRCWSSKELAHVEFYVKVQNSFRIPKGPHKETLTINHQTKGINSAQQMSHTHFVSSIRFSFHLFVFEDVHLVAPGFWNQRARGNFFISPTWSTRPTTGCGARSTSLWVQRNLFWQLSRDRNLHGLGMSHATTASPKLSSWAPRRVGDTVVGRGNAGWMTWRSWHPCPCEDCTQ